MRRFAAPRDRPLTVSTWAVGLLLGALGLGILALSVASDRAGQGLLRLLALALLAPIPLAWALAPRSYLVGGGALVVERRLAPIRLPLASLRAVAALPPGSTAGGLRLLGMSGLFGHVGRSWAPALGHFRLHATRHDRLVVVDAEAGRFVLSPEDPEAFVATLLAAAPGAAAAAPALRPVAPRGPRPWLVGAVAAVAVLLPAGLAVAIIGRAPCAVRLSGEAVLVERRWFADVAIPLAEVRRAEPLAPALGRGWRRTAGTALPGGVAYGRFSSQALGDFELYAWRAGPMVRLETAAGTVVVTPDEPEAFLAGLRARLPAAGEPR